jgi:hypothetical protein
MVHSSLVKALQWLSACLGQSRTFSLGLHNWHDHVLIPGSQVSPSCSAPLCSARKGFPCTPLLHLVPGSSGLSFLSLSPGSLPGFARCLYCIHPYSCDVLVMHCVHTLLLLLVPFSVFPTGLSTLKRLVLEQLLCSRHLITINWMKKDYTKVGFPPYHAAKFKLYVSEVPCMKTCTASSISTLFFSWWYWNLNSGPHVC